MDAIDQIDTQLIDRLRIDNINNDLPYGFVNCLETITADVRRRNLIIRTSLQTLFDDHRRTSIDRMLTAAFIGYRMKTSIDRLLVDCRLITGTASFE
jgi:hypothetical protein